MWRKKVSIRLIGYLGIIPLEPIRLESHPNAVRGNRRAMRCVTILKTGVTSQFDQAVHFIIDRSQRWQELPTFLC